MELQNAYLERARSALDLAGQSGDTALKARAFVQIGHALLRERSLGEALPALARHPNDLVRKAAAALTTDQEWSGAALAELAAAFLAEHAGGDLLSAIAKHGRVLPPNRRVMLASGFAAGTYAEASPVAVRHLDLAAASLDDATTVRALAVLSDELAKATGPAGLKLFETELARAVTRGTNQAVLDQLIDSDTQILPGTGNPLVDLTNALGRAAAPGGFVVAASPGATAGLALSTGNRAGMPITGGTLVEGIEVVPVTNGSTYMTLIPASRIALTDFGLELSATGHAAVSMADPPAGNSATPTGAQLVSLWQTNSLGVLAQRMFCMHAPEDPAVVVVAYATAEG